MSTKSLELRTFQVDKVEFGDRTALSGGTLTIDRDEIATLAASDPAFDGVDVMIVRPRESVRIPQITDFRVGVGKLEASFAEIWVDRYGEAVLNDGFCVILGGG